MFTSENILRISGSSSAGVWMPVFQPEYSLTFYDDFFIWVIFLLLLVVLYIDSAYVTT